MERRGDYPWCSPTAGTFDIIFNYQLRKINTFLDKDEGRARVKQEIPETQSCCSMKEEEKEEHPYMKIAIPHYTTLSSTNDASKQSTIKHRYIFSTEQAVIASTNLVNSLPIPHQNISGCSSNLTLRPSVRTESMINHYYNPGKMQGQKSMLSSSSSAMYRNDGQTATYRESVRRKIGKSSYALDFSIIICTCQ